MGELVVNEGEDKNKITNIWEETIAEVDVDGDGQVLKNKYYIFNYNV